MNLISRLLRSSLRIATLTPTLSIMRVGRRFMRPRSGGRRKPSPSYSSMEQILSSRTTQWVKLFWWDYQPAWWYEYLTLIVRGWHCLKKQIGSGVLVGNKYAVYLEIISLILSAGSYKSVFQWKKLYKAFDGNFHANSHFARIDASRCQTTPHMLRSRRTQARDDDDE